MNGTQSLVNYIKREIAIDPSKAFDARDLTTRYTCDVISSCLYGVDAHSFTSEKPLVWYYGRKFLKGVMDSLISFFPKTMLSNDVAQFFINMTKDSIQFRLQNNSKREDLLSQTISLQQSKEYDDLDIVAHCLTLFLDSFETSGVTLQNALYHLGLNPKAQDELRQELNGNLEKTEIATYEKINELSYLDQVFYETLRLHPPLLFTTRVCSEITEVQTNEGQKFFVQKDSAIWIPIHSIHRDSGKIRCI